VKNLKLENDALTEELVASFVGQYINVPRNMHEVPGAGMENIWFAGRVAGYEKSVFAFNPADGSFSDPKTYLSVIMTDGKGYVLADDCTVESITKDEFDTMVTEHIANTALEKEAEAQISAIISPQNKLLLPGEDF
jgi:hypothetical protein